MIPNDKVTEIYFIIDEFSKEFEQLFVDGVHLITKPGKNMKNALMLLQDRIMLRKRALMETVNDELKNMCQIEHTRHRSFDNFVINILSEKTFHQYKYGHCG